MITTPKVLIKFWPKDFTPLGRDLIFQKNKNANKLLKYQRRLMEKKFK